VIGVAKGVAGGSLIVEGRRQREALAAARRASEAVDRLPGVIAPFPGVVVRSGSKVGSRYNLLRASTNDPYCPTLRGHVNTALDRRTNCAYEVVIDGVDETAVARAMAAAARAAAGPEIVRLSALDFGGNLGKFRFYLR